jgi:L-aminopeptidase/D-esterase-like protein
MPPSPLRARELGIPFPGEPGPLNALTDVPGVGVGYTTLIEGEGVRTGVTAILPRGVTGVGVPCAAGWYSLNGNGEMTGTTWISETGSLGLPVLITNTHAVGSCHRGVIDWVVSRAPRAAAQWLLPVVAETWDGYLNDINGDHVHPAHAVAALDAAAVGGGTGMNCYEFKGGSGTASRRVRHGQGPDADEFTVAAFVQANFGARDELRIAGVPVGAHLADDNPLGTSRWFAEDLQRAGASPAGAGSVIVILATDAPLLPGQCSALARRVPLGLARTGTSGSHFSGDIFLAFSTANAGALTSTFPSDAQDHPHAGAGPIEALNFIPWGWMDPFYTAVVQAVEEAVVNALVAAEPMTGRHGHHSPALPVERIQQLLLAAGQRTRTTTV